MFKDGVLVVADKRIVENSWWEKALKVFQVDDHLGATASEFLSDGRILIERAQVIAQQHRITYNEPIGTETLVKEISNLKQLYTQSWRSTTFGVSIMFVAWLKNHSCLLPILQGSF